MRAIRILELYLIWKFHTKTVRKKLFILWFSWKFQFFSKKVATVSVWNFQIKYNYNIRTARIKLPLIPTFTAILFISSRKTDNFWKFSKSRFFDIFQNLKVPMVFLAAKEARKRIINAFKATFIAKTDNSILRPLKIDGKPIIFDASWSCHFSIDIFSG